jgi:hypothetical protein
MKHDEGIAETTRRRVAIEASCDVRTVSKVLAGKPVRGLAGERARAALAAVGINVPPAPRWRPARRAKR